MMIIPVWVGWFYLMVSVTNAVTFHKEPAKLIVAMLTSVGWSYLLFGQH